MREILFRGIRSDNGEWCEGGLLYDSEQNESYIAVSFEEKAAYFHEVIPETVGQYTGMTDTNGIKIFEDDILKLDYIGENRGVEGYAKVVFENGKFGVLWGWNLDFVCLDGFANTTITVIGNRHDNPHLI